MGVYPYYSYTAGNGPFHVWGENPPAFPLKALAAGAAPKLVMPADAQTVYTDRLRQWDEAKHDALCQQHFGTTGQNWNARTPEQISAFLSDYLGRPVEAVACWQYNHAMSGYPIWLLFFRSLQDDT